jgi:HD-GYP domain-containing protein (c-di-GMP phosphodiesterase class II)
MAKCHLCGHEYVDEATYCVQCGARVNDRAATVTLAPADREASEWATTEELLEVSRALSSTLDLYVLLRKIDDSAIRLIGANASAILLFDQDRKSLQFKTSSGEKADVVEPLTVTDGIAWWVAQHGEVARVDDVTKDERFTGTVDRITGYKTKSVLCVPMTLENETIGVIEVLNKTDGTSFTTEDERVLSVLAGQGAVAVRNARLATEQRNFFIHVIEILVMAIESNALIPEGHCWRVAKSATAIGRNLGMEDQELQDLYYAAALHDLGVLSPRQSRIERGNRMRSHPILGASMVRTIVMLRDTEPMIRHHHEHFDGSGYPDGLKGEEIPLGARIIAAVEAYEEAISGGKSQSSAKAEIQENSGKLFDPKVVDAFLGLMGADEG